MPVLPASPAIPDLNPLWRPNQSGPSPQDRDDREQIRQAAGLGATRLEIYTITMSMNDLAEVSAAAVSSVQGWIDEVIELEEVWAGKVIDGSSTLGSLREYEGPQPGAALSEDDRTQKIGPIEYDTSLLRVRMVAASEHDSERAHVAGRVELLRGRIVDTLALPPRGRRMGGGTRLVRS